MKKLYVATKDAVLQNKNMFHPATGFHYIDLPGGQVLLCAEFQNEDIEENWNQLADVAALPDPIFEGKMTVKDQKDDANRKFNKAHSDALASIGVQDTDTVLDVSRKASAIHPLVRIRHIG